MNAADFGLEMRPEYRIELNGEDITSIFRQRVLKLVITDNRGLELDTFNLELDDGDGKIILPQRGSVLQISIGWRGSPLLDKGKFIISEIKHNGAPDTVNVVGFSADISDGLTESRSQSYDQMTLGQIVQMIAGRSHLGVSMPGELAAMSVRHIDQTSESDLQFLARLAKFYGAVATIKNGKILLLKPGKGTTAKGEPLPEATLRRREGDLHALSYSGHEKYIGVEAYWLHLDKASTGKVTLTSQLSPDDRVFEPFGKEYLKLKTRYSSEDEARHAVQAAWEQNLRISAKLEFRLAMGRAELFPEMLVDVQGFKSLIDKHKWIISHVIHTIDAEKGFYSNVSLEMVIDNKYGVTAHQVFSESDKSS